MPIRLGFVFNSQCSRWFEIGKKITFFKQLQFAGFNKMNI